MFFICAAILMYGLYHWGNYYEAIVRGELVVALEDLARNKSHEIINSTIH